MSKFRRIVGPMTLATMLAIPQMSQVLSGQAARSGSATQAKAQPAARSATAPPDLSTMPLVSVTIVQIKPELLTEYIDFHKTEVIPTLQKAGYRQFSAFATVFGQGYEYGFLTPLANFAMRDGDDPVVKALGQDAARAFSQKLRRFAANVRSYAVRLRTDLSYHPDPNAQLPVVVVSNYSIVQGRATDFEAYIKNDLMAAHKQLGTGGFTVYQGLFGGDGNTFVVGTLLHNFAELDKGPAATRAYGAVRAAAIQQKLSGIVAHVERTVVREVPELGLSIRPTSELR